MADCPDVSGSPTSTIGRVFIAYLGSAQFLGTLPAALGLIVLSLIFGIARETFFSSLNFANLINQSAQVVFIAMGLVLVLPLGEIDLSAGHASGVCGAVTRRRSAGTVTRGRGTFIHTFKSMDRFGESR